MAVDYAVWVTDGCLIRSEVWSSLMCSLQVGTTGGWDEYSSVYVKDNQKCFASLSDKLPRC